MKTMKTLVIAATAAFLAGCCTCPPCIDIDQQKLQKAVEVKEFLEHNELSLQKLKKCIEIADKIELNEASLAVEDGVLQILVK